MEVAEAPKQNKLKRPPGRPKKGENDHDPLMRLRILEEWADATDGIIEWLLSLDALGSRLKHAERLRRYRRAVEKRRTINGDG